MADIPPELTGFEMDLVHAPIGSPDRIPDAGAFSGHSQHTAAA
jgi:hypothetical protein